MALQTVDVPRALAPSPGRLYHWARHAFTRRNMGLWLPAGVLVFIIGACYLGPAIGHLGPPSDANLQFANLPIGSPGHLLGTDQLGNDMLSRCLFGGRASFEVGFGAVALGFLVGSNVGLIAGYYGGKVEALIMRCLDVLLAFPGLILAMAVAAYLGPSLQNLIFALAFFTIPAYARLSRAATIRVKTREFVQATRIMGGTPGYVALRHVYPNILPTLMTFAPLGVGIAMLVEAALSFLGLGIRPPQPSWGNMIANGQTYLSSYPGYVFIPAVFLLVTIVCLNLVGEQVRMRWSK